MDFFDYFQVLCLAFWLFVFLGRTLHLRLVKNISPITLGIGKSGFRAVVEILFLVGLLAWCMEVFLYAVHADFRLFPAALNTLLFDHPGAKVAGAILSLLGIGLFVWALASFGDSWRVGIDKRKPGQLVTNGAFAFSRNPIFLFIDLYFVGTFLLNGSVFFLLATLLVVVGLHYQILQEEHFLSQQYGKSYQAYQSQTGRYFGVHET